MTARVAVTGIGAITALGADAAALWTGLREGRSGLRSDDDASPVARVALETPPEEVRALVLAEHAAREAIADANWSTADLASPRTLLVVATTKAGIDVASRFVAEELPASDLERSFLFALAPQLAARLGTTGPMRTVSVACASGVAAVGMARIALALDEADRALVVGADACSDFIQRGFLRLQALDASGARPFDVDRQGLSIGEGAAAVTLERSERGTAVLGYGASNDANHITGPARDGRGLVRALRVALEEASIAPSDVGFGVLHGTGTRFNDASEGVAYATVFGEDALPSISIKGAVGHIMGGAGLANLVVTIQALRAGEVPPSVGLRQRDPDIGLDVVDAVRAIDARAAVTSASGFGGVNAALVVEAPRAGRAPARGPRIDAYLTATVTLPAERSAMVAQIGTRAARRLDDLSLFGVATMDALVAERGLAEEELFASPHGLVLGTALGCLESDHAFYVRELHPEQYDPSPRLFAYTLPNIALGEAAIRHGSMGEHVLLSAGRASAMSALVEGVRRIEAGEWVRAFVLAVDAIGPAAAQLFDEPAAGVARGWLLERRDAAATIVGKLTGTTWANRIAPLTGSFELLGAGGSTSLDALVADGRSGEVRVECPSGYGAQICLTVPR